MKIAFATIYDARDVRRGSGWPYYLSRELERQGHRVEYLGPLSVQFPLGTRLCRYFSTRILRQRYRSFQDPFIAQRLAQNVEEILKTIDYDVFLTNDYAIAGFTRAHKPIVVYTDAMFPINYRENVNPRLAALSPLSVRFCQAVTRKGLERANLCIFPAVITAKEAVNKYDISREKVLVIPFGANLEDPGPEFAAVRSMEGIKAKGRLNILFVGKDWKRKGGDTVVETVRLLRDANINAVLDIVGALPEGLPASEYINLHGYLNKSDDSDLMKLNKLYQDSDLFLMPSVAEGFGIVYMEAAAYGLPSIGYRAPGVESAVDERKSGILLEPSVGSDGIAEVISNWFEEPDQYNSLVAGARRHFEENGRWSANTTRFIAAIEKQLVKSIHDAN